MRLVGPLVDPSIIKVQGKKGTNSQKQSNQRNGSSESLTVARYRSVKKLQLKFRSILIIRLM